MNLRPCVEPFSKKSRHTLGDGVQFGTLSIASLPTRTAARTYYTKTVVLSSTSFLGGAASVTRRSHLSIVRLFLPFRLLPTRHTSRHVDFITTVFAAGCPPCAVRCTGHIENGHPWRENTTVTCQIDNFIISLPLTAPAVLLDRANTATPGQ